LLLLSSCAASIELGKKPVVETPPGSTVEEKNGVEIVEPPAPARALCNVRARHFVGSVALPCEDVARETSPGGRP
jgi:hypothetical protein